jgi:monoamine oxidase
MSERVVIVGGGLAGVFAAHLLQARGHRDWVLLEAGPALGGRVKSVGQPGLDLGATWYWPDLQPELAQWVTRLGLRSWPQHEQGDQMLERSRQMPPERWAGSVSSAPGWRLEGGMQALIEALAAGLPPHGLHLGTAVRTLCMTDAGVRVEALRANGQALTLVCDQVLLALPPRLAAQSLQFEPSLPAQLHQAWQDCDTWMAPHAKYLAVYDTPFWRAQGLSGAARSAVGPLVEVHDASSGEQGALFGFLGWSAAQRQSMGDDAVRAHARAQLVRLYGPQAGQPVAEHLHDWAKQPFTATEQDRRNGGGHPSSPPPAPAEGPWAGRLQGVASEWSERYPGYLAGALDAAQAGLAAMSGPLSDVNSS